MKSHKIAVIAESLTPDMGGTSKTSGGGDAVVEVLGEIVEKSKMKI